MGKDNANGIVAATPVQWLFAEMRESSIEPTAFAHVRRVDFKALTRVRRQIAIQALHQVRRQMRGKWSKWQGRQQLGLAATPTQKKAGAVPASSHNGTINPEDPRLASR